MSSCAVIIAASNLMPALKEKLAGSGEMFTFADSEPIQALQTILERKPQLIVLERLFAATPRGAALINRIKTDPNLAHAELRIMSHTGDYSKLVSTPSAVETPAATAASGSSSASSAPVATADAPRPLDWHGTRRAQRYRLRAGVEIQLDGNPANIVDLSRCGAQVVSSTILRPNQKVRVSIPNDDFVMRFRASVAWAKFELPNPTEPPRYRAGVDFADADPAAVEAFCDKNKEQRNG